MTDAQTLLQEGLSAFRARAYDQALQAWRALLDAEPDNQQVQQLVERTEVLAAEGHLVHTLKEELADLREELATTRQARNDLLIEMARVHRRYQAREARLWRLQEEREWELREALAQAELSGIVDDSATVLRHDLEALVAQELEAPPQTLDDAHQQIQQLLHTLRQAHQRILALESAATTDESQVEGEPTRSTPDKDDEPRESAPAKSSGTHTRPSRTVPAKTDVNKVLATDPPIEADSPPPRTRSAPHTQTSRTLAASRFLVEPDGDPDLLDEDDATSFDGPLIADEWLNAPKSDEDIESLPDDLVSLVKDVSKTKASSDITSAPPETSEETPSIDEGADDDLGPDKESALLDALDDVSQETQPSDDAFVPDTQELKEEATDKETLEEDTDGFQITDDAAELFKADEPDGIEPPQNAARTAAQTEHKPAPVPKRAAKTPPPSQSQHEIPDTARIEPQPMEDTDIADGFSDELTSALGATPAPQRLFTGVQPDLPDIDVFENEPQEMSPEDLEKYPTSVPVRHKEDPSVDDPIARYLLTHVDGVSTFMELRGTVGLPPAAVDRGFRILLAHKVIRVQHQ